MSSKARNSEQYPVVYVGSANHPQVKRSTEADIASRALQNLQKESLPVPENLKRFMVDFDKKSAERLGTYGIQKKDIPAVRGVVIISEKTAKALKEGKFLGMEDFGLIILVDQGLPRDIQMVEFAKVYVHERRHSFSKAHLTIKNGEQHWDRQGFIYRNQLKSAVEEGLAELAIMDAWGLIQKHFPKGVTHSDAIKRRLGYLPSEDDLFVRSIMSIMWDKKPNVLTVSDPSYPRSLSLVRYLKNRFAQSHIDFERYAARAQILGETVTFARLTDREFGPGSYHPLVMATERTAGSLKKLYEGQKK